MDHGKVLARAWNTTWRWKILWVLGFLAALGSGGGNVNYRFSSQAKNFTFPEIAPGWIPLLAIAGIVAVLIGIAFWVISTIATGGLIAGVQQVEDEGSTGFRRAWRVGVQKFWSLLGIRLLIFLAGLVAAAIVVGIFVVFGGIGVLSAGRGNGEGIAAAFGSMAFCFIPLCCVFAIVSLVLSQVVLYAFRAVVLEDMGAIDAIGRGWEVLKDNLGNTVIFWLIFLVIGIGFAIVFGGIALAAFLPFITRFTGFPPSSVSPTVISYVITGLVAFVVMLVLLLTTSIMQVFTSATWTLAYREFMHMEAPRVPPETVAPIPSDVTPPGELPVAEPPIS